VETLLVATFGDFKPLIALMLEAVSISETLVNFYQTTWCNTPEDSHLLKFLFLIPSLHDNQKSKGACARNRTERTNPNYGRRNCAINFGN
jgi:hypothetical protein